MRHGYDQPDETAPEMQSAIQIIEELRDKYAAKYKQFCIDNPGYVMNNYAIREKTCTDILEMIAGINDEVEIIRLVQAKRDRAMEAYKTTPEPNGHWITAGTCDTILSQM